MFSIGSASKFFSFYKALPSYHQTHSQEHKLYPNAGIREQKLNSKPASLCFLERLFNRCVYWNRNLLVIAAVKYSLLEGILNSNSHLHIFFCLVSWRIPSIPNTEVYIIGYPQSLSPNPLYYFSFWDLEMVRD